ncbi:DMT family transporter [Rhodobacteraceae bacterium nBUS_24]
MKLATSHPHAFGMLVTALGVLVFVPDALLLRLIGGDMLAVSVWRGLLAGSVFLIWSYGISNAPRPTLRESLSGLCLLVAVLEGASMTLFCASIGHTSVSNALFIFATAPFIAVGLSWVFLRELVPLQTLLAISVSMMGVIVIVSGSFSQASLIGDGLAFLNACTVAGFYVALRKIGPKNMLPSIGAGYVIGALCVMPFADFQTYTTAQVGYLLLNGAIMLPVAIGLLSIGPRYLPAAEVSMLTVLEVILAPSLVWFVLGENPGAQSLIGGAIIIGMIFAHTLWRLRQ